MIAVAPMGVFSVIHAGWRGVENGIAQKAIKQMAERVAFLSGFSEEEVLAHTNVYLGPYIHAECFETGEGFIGFLLKNMARNALLTKRILI